MYAIFNYDISGFYCHMFHELEIGEDEYDCGNRPADGEHLHEIFK
jgi:hypothetical protein